MLNTISKWFNIQTVDAHCDVPCGVYDPSTAQIAAKTVHALTKKIIDLPMPGASAKPEELLCALLATTSPA